MPNEKTAGCGIHCMPPTIPSLDQHPAMEWTAAPGASAQGKDSASTYAIDPNSDFDRIVDKGLGFARAVVAGVFSVMGLSCSTEFKPSPEDSWEDGDIAELDSPADEVEFLDTAEDSEDADAMDAEEEPATIVCEKIGTDVRVTDVAGTSELSSLAWTGSEFGVSFEDDKDGNWEIYFGRISPTGAVIDSGIRLTDAVGISSRSLALWNGSEFGVGWYDGRSGSNEIMFRRISPIGDLIDSESQVSTSGDSRRPSIIWNGSGYGVSWYDDRNGNWDIYFSRLSSEGALLDTNLQITNDTSDSNSPSLVWSGSEYALAWHDYRHGDIEIYFRRLSDRGDLVADPVRVTTEEGDSIHPSIVWTGSEYGIGWYDYRDGNSEIYFTRLSATGALLSSEIRITDDPAESLVASLVWNGSEYGLSWSDRKFDDDLEIFFRRIAADGSLIGDELRITGAFGDSEHPSLAWTGSEYAISWDDDRDGNAEIYFARVGCHPE